MYVPVWLTVVIINLSNCSVSPCSRELSRNICYEEINYEETAPVEYMLYIAAAASLPSTSTNHVIANSRAAHEATSFF